jgi:mRNA-degrading endonuclease RelE of RelBE toxin-antitoxin system
MDKWPGGFWVAYRVDVSVEAELDLRFLRASEQSRIRVALPQYLAFEPSVPSNARKALDPNPLGVGWELRLGSLRAFYDVDDGDEVVRVERIGYKRGNDLYVRGRLVDLRS